MVLLKTMVLPINHKNTSLPNMTLVFLRGIFCSGISWVPNAILGGLHIYLSFTMIDMGNLNETFMNIHND
jgi:hypothetical protein